MRLVKRTEDVLVKSDKFRLPSKRQLQQLQAGIEVIVIDVAETEIETPKKNKQTPYYSGKRLCHTLKMQLIINQLTKEIICTALYKGSRHDFHWLPESKTPAREKIQL